MRCEVHASRVIQYKTLDDDMISHLSKMPALRKLKIVQSGLSDDSKDALLQLKQLKHLESSEIRGKNISPSVAAEIRDELLKSGSRD